MPLQIIPAYAGGLSHPVELDRQVLQDRYRKSGMTAVGSFAMTTVPGQMALAISKGNAFLKGTETAQQGGYFVWSDAAQNIPWPAPSAQPRIDMLVLRVIDTQYGSDPGTSRAVWEVVQGTPAASPVAPATSVLNFGNPSYKPGAVMVRGYVRVDNGDTDLVGNTITAVNEYAAGSTYSWTADTLATLPANGVALPGDTAYVTTTGRRYEMLPSGVWYPANELTIVKTDTTLRSGTTTAFTDIGLNVEPNTTWRIEADLTYRYSNQSGLGFSLTWPTGGECQWGMTALDQSATTAAGNLFSGAFDTPTPGTYFSVGGLSAGNGRHIAQLHGTLFNGPTEGLISVLHKPNSSGPVSVGLYRGSTLKLTPIKP